MAECNDCGASIFWVPTRNGSRMPLDRARVPGGNVDIDEEGFARVYKGDPMLPGYVCHHATCPEEKKRRAAEQVERRRAREQAASKQLGLFGGKP